jgi:hypothetical protein
MTWTTFLTAAEPVAPADSSGLPTWLTIVGSVVAVLLSSSAVAAAFGAVRAGAAERRREYTAAARALTAWAEYPWRIRRRTSDQPEVLAALAERGHDLQETLADREAWCAAEHEVMGQLMAHLRTELSVPVRPAIEKAWAGTDLITEGADMNLSDKFIVDSRADELRACFSACVHERFGARRLRRDLRSRVNAHLTNYGYPHLPP